jgi:Xaa-Pro aminopeptidase
MEYYGKVTARLPDVEVRNSSRFLEQMRMHKSDIEVAAIEQAVAITHRGLTALLAAMQPGMTEFQLDGVLENAFKQQGAQHHAFEPIVGAGIQSTVLHYERRDQPLESGDLLLLDVGAEWHHYCADISRTIPVNGKFTERQAEIYDIALRAQQAAIEAIRPGVTVREVHEIARDVIRDAGYVDDFIHYTSHHLGVEVHDAADYGIPLAPGMVITVEPGIYLPDEEIGIRIEDDVLVTVDGYRVLTESVPKRRRDVEAWITDAKKPR